MVVKNFSIKLDWQIGRNVEQMTDLLVANQGRWPAKQNKSWQPMPIWSHLRLLVNPNTDEKNKQTNALSNTKQRQSQLIITIKWGISALYLNSSTTYYLIEKSAPTAKKIQIWIQIQRNKDQRVVNAGQNSSWQAYPFDPIWLLHQSPLPNLSVWKVIRFGKMTGAYARPNISLGAPNLNQ